MLFSPAPCQKATYDVPDPPKPASSKCKSDHVVKHTSPYTTPSTKKPQPLPRSAPRDVTTRGKFVFLKDVRIREYNMPRRPSNAMQPNSSEYQCRDGFSAAEASLGYPRPMMKKAHESFEQLSPLAGGLPPTPASTSQFGMRSPSLGARLELVDSPPILYAESEDEIIIKTETGDDDDQRFQEWLHGAIKQ
jgi:hypothetical protein